MVDHDDLIEMGFKPKAKRKEAPPKKNVQPVIVKQEVDTSGQIITQAAAEAIKESNLTFKKALNELVTKIEPRPKKMRVNINRNSAGFMDSFDIDLEY